MRRSKILGCGLLAALSAAVIMAAGTAGGAPGASIATTTSSTTAGPFQYRQSTSNPPPLERTRSVNCTGGRHVVGGGLVNSGGFYTDLNSTYPTDNSDSGSAPDNGWKVYIANNTGSAHKVTVFAVCSHTEPVYRSTTVPSPAGRNASAKAMCPGGRHVTGGGVHSSKHIMQMLVLSSFPVDGPDGDSIHDDGWKAKVDNITHSSLNDTIEVFAICSQGSNVYRQRRFKSPQDLQTKGTAPCPAGRHVSGGGVRTRARYDVQRAHSLFPVDNGDSGSAPDDGWGAVENTLSPSRRFTVFAICH
jgi:hypothetical protein